jgi:hypothetical protein
LEILEGIKGLYQCLEKDNNSMPLDMLELLSTKLYIYNSISEVGFDHLLFKARKLLNETLRGLIEKRRERGRHCWGLLKVLLGAKDEKLIKYYWEPKMRSWLILSSPTLKLLTI